MDSPGAIQKIQSCRANLRYSFAPALSPRKTRAPYSRAIRSVPSVDWWSTIRISAQGRSVSRVRPRRKPSFFVWRNAVMGGMGKPYRASRVYDDGIRTASLLGLGSVRRPSGLRASSRGPYASEQDARFHLLRTPVSVEGPELPLPERIRDGFCLVWKCAE